MEKCARLILQGLFVLCIISAASPNASAEPRLEARISSSVLSLDEPVILTVEVSWPASEGEYKFVVGNPQLLNLRLLRQGESRETLKSGSELTAVKSFVYEMAPLQSGTAGIESFGLQAIQPDSQKLTLLDVPAFNVQVKKPLFRNLIFLAGCVGVAAGGLSWLMMFMVIRRKKRIEAAAAASISAEDKAVKQLHRIAGENQNSAVLMLQAAVSELMNYLTVKWGDDYSKMSDTEVVTQIRNRGYEYREQKNVEDVLQTLHQVKYAGAEISLRDASGFVNKIIAFIESKRVVGQGG